MTAITRLFLVLGLLLCASACGQKDAPPGILSAAEVIAECEACHGPKGVSTATDMPSLTGKNAAYFREMLEQYDAYERHCSVTTYHYGDRAKTPMNMCDIAHSLSDDDKQAVAEYFANQ